MGTLYKVLSRAIIDPSYREQLTKDPRGALKSAGIRMTKIEYSKMTDFMRHFDLARIKGDAELKQKLGDFEAGNYVSGVRG